MKIVDKINSLLGDDLKTPIHLCRCRAQSSGVKQSIYQNHRPKGQR